jgi:hypothetical protein
MLTGLHGLAKQVYRVYNDVSDSNDMRLRTNTAIFDCKSTTDNTSKRYIKAVVVRSSCYSSLKHSLPHPQHHSTNRPTKMVHIASSTLAVLATTLLSALSTHAEQIPICTDASCAGNCPLNLEAYLSPDCLILETGELDNK